MLRRLRVVIPIATITQLTIVHFAIARNEESKSSIAEEISSSSSKYNQIISNSSKQKDNQSNNKINGIDCHIPACSSKMDMFQKSLLSHQKSDKTSTITSSRTTNNNENSITQQSRLSSNDTSIGNSPSEDSTTTLNTTLDEVACPLDKEDLGRASWSIIHTVAAHTSENPTDTEQKHMKQFIESFAALYPCHICAPEFQEYVRLHPPDTHSRTTYVLWCCRLHNHINEYLGKDTMECDLKLLDERWRHGHHGCWPDGTNDDNDFIK